MQSKFFKCVLQTPQGKSETFNVDEAYKLLDYYETCFKFASKEEKYLKDGKLYYRSSEYYRFWASDESDYLKDIQLWIYYKVG